MVAAERWDDESLVALEAARRARRDALPEHTQYTDTGCDVHPSCLTCPLVRCRYDEPGGVRRLFNEGRDHAIAGLQQDGMPVGAIATRFGVSRRTVFRALARARTTPHGGRAGRETEATGTRRHTHSTGDARRGR